MRAIAIATSALAVLVVAACAGTASTEPPSSTSSSTAPASEVAGPWQGPTDGTWEYGDIGYQEPHEGRLSDYRVTLTGPPEFGPLDSSKVEVTGTFLVERFRDRGFDDEIADDLRFGFTPGNLSASRHSENYGLNVTVACVRPTIPIGESTECRVSFRAPHDEIQDFRWWLNGQSVAAWPGQTVGSETPAARSPHPTQ